MTTGEHGRTAPDAEHYLDLPDESEETAGPHFDVVLRGYDRAQVDEHVAGLRRMVAQLRAQLSVRERRRPGPDAAPDRDGADTVSVGSAAPVPASGPSDPGPTGPGRGEPSDEGDVVGAFTDRLQGILQAAEQEAQVVRSRAAESLLAEHAESRAALADLRAQRDAVFDELVRTRDRLDDLVAHPGRLSGPPSYGGGPPRGPWGGSPGPGGPQLGPRPPGPGGPGRGYPPRPHGPEQAAGAGNGALEADTMGDTQGALTVDGMSGGPSRS